jgi:hypothetical protein
LTNNGSGVFGSNAPVNVGSKVVWAVAADVNGDHKQDLICASGTSPGTLTVMTNDGSGNFGSNATLSVGYGPFCITGGRKRRPQGGFDKRGFIRRHTDG